jgi:predicted permease
MRFWNRIWSSARAVARRSRMEREMDAELRFHIEAFTEDSVRRGVPREEAMRRARIEFGGIERAKEECREARGVNFIDSLFEDLRFGLRMLGKTPGFTVVATLTLALGIGANTAVFGVVNSVLLKPLNYPNAEELVALHQVAPGAAGLADFETGLLLSPSMYFTYAEQNHAFQSLGVWVAGTANVTGLAEPEQVRTVEISDGVLQALGVPPEMGRWLSPADQIPGGPERVILSYGYWQRRFGGDRSAVGRNLTADSRPREIVGVMPEGFRLADAEFDVVMPLAFERGKLILAGFGYQGIARLKPSVTLAEADADLARMLPIWMDSWSNGPHTDPYVYKTWKITPEIRPLKREVLGNTSDVLWCVTGTIGLVMLVACLNVANLLLVKGEGRQRELAVRAALGAGSGRIVRGLLIESLMLGLLGGTLGVAFANGGVRLLLAVGPANFPRLSEISLDTRAVGFGALLSLLSGLLFGLIPALKYSGSRASLALGSAVRSMSMSRERHRALNALAVGQLAMALVLLVCAGLMIRTFQALRRVEPGFSGGEHLQVLRISIPDSLVKEPERVTRIQNEIVDNLAAIPGVNSAGFISKMPMEGFDAPWNAIYARDKVYSDDAIPPLRLFKQVSPDFFRTAGTRIVAGRGLTWTEVYGLRPVVMVSENLAREMWGTPSAAIGKQLTEFPSMPWHEVIGVIEDVHENGVQEKAPETVYWPSLMGDLYGPGNLGAVRTVTFVIRSERAGSAGFLIDVRQAVWSVNATLPLASVRTMQEVYDKSVMRTSFTLVMLGIAGGMALVLGILGIYGVISYTVSQRRREFGIRLALGAHPRNVLKMVLKQGAKTALVGVVIGLGGAFALTRLMTSLLFGVAASDPVTFVAVAVLLILVALLACYLPARRAMKVDPMAALRYE